MRTLALIVGIVLTAWTLLAMILAMLVPHGTYNVIARSVRGVVWWFARLPLRRMRSYRTQDRWLAGVAPISVILQLVVYAAILIFTLGLIVFGLTDLSFGDSLYQSGSTFTTLGIVEPVNDPSTVVTFIAAFLGLIVVAIFIGYLMGTYSAYVSRESQMAKVAMNAGEPAWGPQVLVRSQLIGLPAEKTPDAEAWIDWITSLRMNHLVNTALGDFRSTSPFRHWSTTLLAVLDAAALRLAADPGAQHPHLIEMVTQGSATLEALARQRATESTRIPNWSIESRVLDILQGRELGSGTRGDDSGLTRAEFDDAIEEIRAVGFPLPDDMDAVWQRFAALRSAYVGHAIELAISHHAVRAPWSGDRTPEVPVIWPVRAGRP